MNDYKFGNFLCELREKNGMTQAELANKLGVTPAAVSKWENGSSKPRVEMLFQVAHLLGVRVEELMSGQYIAEEILDPEVLKQINEQYNYLMRVDTYNTVNVIWRRILAWAIDWNIIG
ncbi:MAG: helix-turn-helix transcriptional regulator, partial [Clostridia bacterium]|nr:helix-turn-helix transcriptional regulator [Clostridia bacterium]